MRLKPLRYLVEQAAADNALRAPTPIARPSRDLRSVLATRYPKERLKDIVLATDARESIHRLLREQRSTTQLERWGLQPRRSALFYGPPGCGKTFAASVKS